MEGFLQDPSILQYWQQLGGMQTLASYGVELRNGTETAIDLHRALSRRLSPRTRIVHAMPALQFCCGDFLFVTPAFVRLFRSIGRIPTT
jgi:serine/threonine protein phosphatase 1